METARLKAVSLLIAGIGGVLFTLAIVPGIFATGIDESIEAVFKEGTFEETAAFLKNGIKDNGKGSRTGLLHYYTARSETEPDEIVKQLDEISPRSAFYIEAQYMRAYLLLAQADYHNAAQLFLEIASAAAPNRADASLMAARSFIMMGEYNEAGRVLSALSSASSSDSIRAATMELQAELALMKGDAERAFDLCWKAVDIENKDLYPSGMISILLRCRSRFPDKEELDAFLKQLSSKADETMFTISTEAALSKKSGIGIGTSTSSDSSVALFRIHLGSFLDLDRADAFRAGLEDRGWVVDMIKKNIGDRTLYQIWLHDDIAESELDEVGRRLYHEEGVKYRLVPLDE